MSYLGLGLAFVGGALVVAVIAAIRRRDPRLVISIAVTAAVLVVLTIVFDSIMIAADLFRYDVDQLVGVRVWRTPVEDLAWPLAAALLLPSLWSLLSPVPARDREVERVG